MDLASLRAGYEKNYPFYTLMNETVSVLLSNALHEQRIRAHSFKFRTKSFDSFHTKVQRKGYQQPFEQCTDLSGCRIICLFSNQIEDVLDVIQKTFVVLELVESEQESDRFSYRSHHAVVRIKRGSCKEYAQLKDLVCEIQVRTILQEAWAEIEHYVNYKKVGIDDVVLRRVNALAALFEIADDQFASIYDEYLSTQDKNALAKQEKLNGVLLYHYCRHTFPWAWNAGFDGIDNLASYHALAQHCHDHGITTIRQLDSLFKKSQDAIEESERFHVNEILNNPAQWPKLHEKVKKAGHFYSPVVMLQRTLEDANKSKKRR